MARTRNAITWTAEKRRILLAMKDKGVKHAEIARYLGVSTSSIDAQLQRIRDGFADPERAKCGQVDRRLERPRQAPKRLPDPHSPIHELLGDPLPGRSALDRKIAGVVDEEDLVDRRRPDGFGVKVTLATGVEG